MTIQKLDDFAENGDKNLNGIDVQQGFVQAEKPARQWFNSLFNSTIKKVNEIATAIDSLTVSTDKIVDGAVTLVKIDPDIKILGGMIAKDAELNTPKLSTTYALTTLDAPNFNIAADGTLKRSTYSYGTAATRNVGTAAGNLVERDANGYPTNNNAVGVGQTWQDMTTSRADNVTYTNSTGRPITVNVLYLSNAGGRVAVDISAKVNGVAVSRSASFSDYGIGGTNLSFIVPTGATYSVVRASTNASISSWSELR